MHRKMSVLLAGLMLMVVTAFALPNNVAANGVMNKPDKARVILVVGAGTTQTLELSYPIRSTNSDLFETHTRSFSIWLEPGPNPSRNQEGCTQRFQVLVNGIPGWNTLSLGITSGEVPELLVNGVVQEEPLDETCFGATNRVVYIVGDAFESSDPGSPASARKNGSLIMYAVVDDNGATAATGRRRLPPVFEGRDAAGAP